MEKAPPARPFFSLLFFAHIFCGALSPDSVDKTRVSSVNAGNARRSRTAGAQRPSERGGVISPEPAFSTDVPQPHFSPATGSTFLAATLMPP